MTDARLPDPAIVVLAGAAGSGKSTWSAAHFRTAEVVSSDVLRATVGSGPADLEATADAFALLDQIVAARSKRSLTTVIDTLGLDRERRTDYQRLAREAGLPAVLVIMNTAAALCRERNRERDRPVPAPVLTDQLRKIKKLLDAAQDEGWDQTLIIEQHNAAESPIVVQPNSNHDHDPGTRPRVV
ncbi:MAG TPA: ATP-binding protein, partial [Propionibacteriaceae bacterium]|nr:ATP-binding protein [Propionibacteriaceae bacterium]